MKKGAASGARPARWNSPNDRSHAGASCRGARATARPRHTPHRGTVSGGSQLRLALGTCLHPWVAATAPHGFLLIQVPWGRLLLLLSVSLLLRCRSWCSRVGTAASTVDYIYIYIYIYIFQAIGAGENQTKWSPPCLYVYIYIYFWVYLGRKRRYSDGVYAY